MNRRSKVLQRLPLAIFLIGLGIATAVAWQLHQRLDADAASAFERRVTRLGQSIAQQFRAPVHGLQGLAAMYASVGSPNRAEFQRYVQARDLPGNFPSVLAFGFVDHVARGGLDAFIARERASGVADFDVRYLSSSNLPDLYIVRWSEPAGPAPGVQGLDLGSDPARRASIERAIATGQPTLSERLRLRFGPQEQRAGFLLFVPVFRHDAPTATPQQRRQALLGLLFAPIMIPQVLDELARSEDDQLAFELLDPEARFGTELRVYDSAGRSGMPADGAGNAPSRPGRFQATLAVPLPGRTLTLNVRSKAAIDGLAARWAPILALAAGALVSALLAALLRQQTTARQRAESVAHDMTAELQRLALVARETSNAVIITDPRGLTTWVNAGFERITGYSAAEVIGRKPGDLLQCEATDRGTLERMRTALKAGEGFHCELFNRGKSGREYWLDIEIQPLRDGVGRLTGFMAIESDITERRRTEKQLLASQAMLDKAERIGGVGGWALDLQTRTFAVTDQGCRILDRPPGHRPTLAQVMEQFEPQAQATIRQMLLQDWNGAGQRDVELPMTTINGRQIWLRLVAEPEYADGGMRRIVGVLQDITESLRAASEVQRSAALLRGAMDALDEAFVLYDPDDRLVYCNQKYRDLFQVSRELIVPGVRFDDILRHSAQAGQFPDAVGRVDDWVAECMRKHRTGDVTRIQRVSDGRVLRIIDRRMPDGHTVGFRVDLTDMARAREAAERAQRLQTEFIATMSHELRTPLQSITGFSDLGKHFAKDMPQFCAMFTDIHAGGMRMLRLVNGLLDVSKIEGSAGSMNLRPADLAVLAAEVARELMPLAAQRRLTLMLPRPLPSLGVMADPFRLQQVIRNVLANAIRFAPAGSAIDLDGLGQGSGWVELQVRDHGPGIPPDELEQIFDAFVQSSRTRDGSGGTGLGLTISRKIMQAHNGSLTAENAEGGGALFRIRLPAVALLPTKAPRPLTTAAPAPAPVQHEALEAG